jgi:hypothetical protein
MNNRLAKKIRQATRKAIKFDLNELDSVLSDKGFFERLSIAFKILFKYHIYKNQLEKK